MFYNNYMDVTSMTVIIHTMYHRNKLDKLIQLFQLLTEIKYVFLMHHFIICTIILAWYTSSIFINIELSKLLFLLGRYTWMPIF